MSAFTPNMSLVKWDLSADPYDHNQLAANWQKIDGHNHASGNGVQVPSGGLQDGAVITAKLANLSVTTPKIADAAVTADKMDKAYVHPLGVIWPWWRPNLGTAVPDNWAIAMGQTLTAGQHSFAGGGSIVLPDLRKRFLLGADTSGTGSGPNDPPDIGGTGGAQQQSFAHSHTLAEHGHGIFAESPVTSAVGSQATDSTGSHRHYIDWPIAQDQSLSQTYYIVKPGDSSIESGDPGGSLTNGAFVAYGANGLPLALNAYTLPSGGFDYPSGSAVQTFYGGSSFNGTHFHTISGHSHTVTAHAHGGATAGSGILTTNTALSTVDTRPAYVGVLYLIKVKY